jgi:hypothetical protein
MISSSDLGGITMDEDRRIETHPDLMNPDWRKHAERDAWLGSKQERKQFRKQSKRARSPRGDNGKGRRWGFLAFVVILAVTTAAIVLVGRTPHAESADAPFTPAPTSVNPTSAAHYAPVDLKHAYARTPADAWQKGIDGITSPAAADVGPFKAAAVADAYAKVKQAISAAHLDPAVLNKHDPKAFLALFAPDAQDQMRPIVTGAQKAANGADVSSYLTEVADGYQLLDQGPRTFGSLTARTGQKPGELVVEAKYVIAYAFDNPHPETLTGPLDIVSFFRADENFVVLTGKRYDPKSLGLWIDDGKSLYEAIGCSALDAGFLAPAYSNPSRVGLPGEEDKDLPGVYDPNLPVPQEDTCPKK